MYTCWEGRALKGVGGAGGQPARYTTGDPRAMAIAPSGNGKCPVTGDDGHAVTWRCYALYLLSSVVAALVVLIEAVDR